MQRNECQAWLVAAALTAVMLAGCGNGGGLSNAAGGGDGLSDSGIGGEAGNPSDAGSDIGGEGGSPSDAGAGTGGGEGGSPSDAGSGIPQPPALGAQLDRMGRAGVGEYLIGAFSGADALNRQAAYRQASDPKTWLTTTLSTNVTVARELESNIGPFDAIDTGQRGGCGNALDYVTPPNSYSSLATVLADDQLYIDTEKGDCSVYFALELELTSSDTLGHTTCGGRTLRHDALDVLISVLESGGAGLNQINNFVPLTFSGATVHSDISNAFPFLGVPNP